MKISFHKGIKGYDNLKDFFTEEPMELHDAYRPYIRLHDPKINEAFYTGFDKDYPKLNKHLGDALEKSLTDRKFPVTRTSHGELWISGDNPFSLSFSSSFMFPTIYVDKNRVQLSGHKEDWEYQGTKEQKGWLFRREVPVFRENPLVHVSGQVYFEKLEDVDTVPVLEALKEQRYDSRVISTPEELQQAFDKIKQARSDSGYRSSDYSRSQSSSGAGLVGLAGLAAGVIIGTSL